MARKETCRVVKASKDIAETYKKEKIKAHQLAQPTVDPTVIENQIRQNHAMKEMHRKVPSSKPRTSGGISMIKIPVTATDDPKDPKTKFSSIVDPVQIENLIIERNKKHFRQAEFTPLATPHITQSLGFSGTLPIAQDLLKGTADVPTLTPDRFGGEILKKCERRLPETPSDIHFDVFKSAYKSWRVGTSTSPSNRHLSHQHALFQPHGIPPDKPEKSSRPRNHATQSGQLYTAW